MPEEFVAETADALRHFYDFVYLRRHAILTLLRELVGSDPAVAAQKLRSLLLDTIEELRPLARVADDSLAWRPYEIVHSRCVLGKELAEVEREFGLGERQVQREQRRAFAEIAARLWARNQVAQVTPATGATLAQEIARAASELQAFDAVEQVGKALAAVGPLAERYGVALTLAPASPSPRILGDAALYRQLLVSALSWLVRTGARAIAVQLVRQGTHIVSSLESSGAADTPAGSHLQLPDPLLVLAQAGGAEVSLQALPTGHLLRFSLPAEGGEWTVVIVEDNEELAALFARYLARRGYRVVEIADPTTALQRMAAEQPDAVVLDVMMGGVDGWEILQRLRADPRLGHVPVAVCSVLDEAELAQSLGADEYLKKPVMPARLQECVARLVRSRKHVPAGPARSAAAGPSSAA